MLEEMIPQNRDQADEAQNLEQIDGDLDEDNKK